jgi:hypothetical protein
VRETVLLAITCEMDTAVRLATREQKRELISTILDAFATDPVAMALPQGHSSCVGELNDDFDVIEGSLQCIGEILGTLASRDKV